MPAGSLRAHVVSRDIRLRCCRNTIGGIAGIGVLLVTASLPYAESRQASAEEPGKGRFLTIEVVDPEGRPVAGALLGQRVVSTSETKPPKLYGLGNTQQTQKTDETGRLDMNDREIARQLEDQGIAVCAYHPDRELIGLVKLTSKDLGTVKQLMVSQGCCVDAKINSSELDQLGYPFGQRIVMVAWHQVPHKRIVYCRSPADHVRLRLPPGEYHLDALGNDMVLPIFQSDLTILEDQREIEITFDLPASPLARLIGNPAPELRIKEWKNGEPVTFDDLRGKVVLVDFWGYWCGGCVRIMPELFKLHDQYKDKGLVIVAVHDDSVASIAEMDNKLAGIREELWGGRDLPFLVALDGGGKTKIPNTEHEVDGETTAAYGILSWPTTFLIDQNGIVVGPVSCFTDECRTKVEELLNGKRSQPHE